MLRRVLLICSAFFMPLILALLFADAFAYTTLLAYTIAPTILEYYPGSDGSISCTQNGDGFICSGTTPRGNSSIAYAAVDYGDESLFTGNPLGFYVDVEFLSRETDYSEFMIGGQVGEYISIVGDAFATNHGRVNGDKFRICWGASSDVPWEEHECDYIKDATFRDFGTHDFMMYMGLKNYGSHSSNNDVMFQTSNFRFLFDSDNYPDEPTMWPNLYPGGNANCIATSTLIYTSTNEFGDVVTSTEEFSETVNANLLTNGGFESGFANWGQIWVGSQSNFYYGNPMSDGFAVTAQEGYHVAYPSAGANYGNVGGIKLQTHFDAKPGQYIVRFVQTCPQGSDCQRDYAINVGSFQAGDPIVGIFNTNSYKNATLNDAWGTVETEFTVMTPTEHVSGTLIPYDLELELNAPFNANDVPLFDDFALLPGDGSGGVMCISPEDFYSDTQPITTTPPISVPTPFPTPVTVYTATHDGDDAKPPIDPIDHGETCLTVGPIDISTSEGSEPFGFELCVHEWEFEIGLLGFDFSTTLLAYIGAASLPLIWFRTR